MIGQTVFEGYIDAIKRKYVYATVTDTRDGPWEALQARMPKEAFGDAPIQPGSYFRWTIGPRGGSRVYVYRAKWTKKDFREADAFAKRVAAWSADPCAGVMCGREG